jgi:lipoprotein NlpI
MSRLGRRKEAERMLLPVGPDDRVPMAEVYALYAGKGDARAVLQAIERIGRNERERKAALFYGHLYLGLFAEANGEIKRAREHIQKAFDQRVGGYMWEVARIHLDRMPKK